jgi:hypothetical protein
VYTHPPVRARQLVVVIVAERESSSKFSSLGGCRPWRQWVPRCGRYPGMRGRRAHQRVAHELINGQQSPHRYSSTREKSMLEFQVTHQEGCTVEESTCMCDRPLGFSRLGVVRSPMLSRPPSCCHDHPHAVTTTLNREPRRLARWQTISLSFWIADCCCSISAHSTSLLHVGSQGKYIGATTQDPTPPASHTI